MDFLKLEQQRHTLETTLQELRQSLKHWQTWEAEYEGLKEELFNVNEDLSSTQLTNIAETYNGDLVTEKEVRELAGLDKDSPRSAKQIVGLIERRQEYVQKNIDTVQRQYFEAEAKAEELAFAAANQGGGEAGLPLTEIHEELDEEGNVISSHLSQPEETTSKVVESLRKAGLSKDDLEKTPESKIRSEHLKPAITNASPIIPTSTMTVEKRTPSDPIMASPGSDGSHGELERPQLRKKSVSFAVDTKEAVERPRPDSEDGLKRVSFNDKISVMPAAPPPDTRSVSFSPKVEEIPPLDTLSPEVKPMTEGEVEKAKQLMHSSEDTERTTAVEDVGEDDIVMPEDDSPEDARLRREMLDYHMNEVGNVVAQIDLDEAAMDTDPDAEEDDNSSYYTTSEYLEDEDTPYTTGLSESEESEDEFGRSKRRQITPEYRKEMEALQQKLIGDLGPAPSGEDVSAVDPDLDAKDVRRLVIRDKRSSTSSVGSDKSEKKPGSKKRVSFAESLDVAEPGSPPLKAQKLQESENVAPVTENITERTTATSHSLPQHMANERASGLKRTRALPVTRPVDEPQASVASDLDMEDATGLSEEAPIGPPGVTLANTLMERTPARKPALAPSTEDPDPIMQRRELAAEYYRRRNDIIRQQGGFKNSIDEDDGQGELMEERDGKVKKVSKFKAARLKS